MSAVVTNDENANDVADDSKKKMIRKTMKVDPPNIAFPNREGFGSKSGCHHVMAQLCIELTRKIRRSDFLIITHYLVDIRINLSDED
jgi:hypothetical protein